MKTYEERVADVLNKKAEYLKKKKKHIGWIMLIAGVLCVALIVAVLVMPLLQRVINIHEKPTHIDASVLVKSYDDLYKTLRKVYKSFDGLARGATIESGGITNSKKDTDIPPLANTSEGTLTPEYSNTNLQVAGVQEADIIKTDGRYIYVLGQNNLYIVKATDGVLEQMSKLERSPVDENGQTDTKIEMYVKGDRLIVVQYMNVDTSATEGQSNASDMTDDLGGGEYPGMYHYYTNNGVGVEVYDISDKTDPISIGKYGQEGSYISSRMIGNMLYLVSTKPMCDELDKTDPATYVPKVRKNGTVELVAPTDIYVNANCNKQSLWAYLVVSGIDTSGKGEIISTKALFGYGSTIYANTTSLYVAGYDWYTQKTGSTMRNSDGTKLLRFTLADGKVEFVAETSVKGTILNQFSIDEYNGIFRIVTTSHEYTEKNNKNGTSFTDSNSFNNLYTFNDKLELMGSLTNLAEGECVYSVRFDGTIGYFVTFKQVDPLFTVDLSDPVNPKILSSLKIPGFSEYLHPYADGLLFGLGKNANEENAQVGCLKLSMFDVSDKKNVVELHKIDLYNIGYSEASYNHKAILIDADKGIIALPTESTYSIYSYSVEGGFKKVTEISPNVGYNYWGNMRGLYIGDYMYVYSADNISSYDMENNYAFSSRVKLKGEPKSNTGWAFD